MKPYFLKIGTRNLLISSWTPIQLSHPGPKGLYVKFVSDLHVFTY